jgi:hypothetical protein
MNIHNIVDLLKEEIAKLDRAIEALGGVGSQPARRGRPPKSTGRRHMSASARARISAAMKKRWAQRKGKTAPKKAAPRRKPMSAAAKKKLSKLMKAKWAAKKKT